MKACIESKPNHTSIPKALDSIHGARVHRTMSTAVAAWLARARTLSTCGVSRARSVGMSSAIAQQFGAGRAWSSSTNTNHHGSVWRAFHRLTTPSTTTPPSALSPWSSSRRLVHTGDAYTAADRDKAVKMAGPLGLVAGLFGSVVGEGGVWKGAHVIPTIAKFHHCVGSFHETLDHIYPSR